MDSQTLTPRQKEAVEKFNEYPAWDAPRMIPVDQLEFTDWNVNEMSDAEFAELVAEIEEGGFDEALQVIPVSDDEEEKYLVPAGEHRARAAIALEMDAVPCVLKVHLTEADEADVKMWSVKRNNIRGKVNAQKYVKLEQSLSEKHKVRRQIARDRMLIKGDLLKKLRKANAIVDDDVDDGSAPPTTGSGKDDAGTPPTDNDPPGTSAVAARKRLLAALKSAEEEVLLQSADTVEHGYLFFVQGDGSATHLVVDETEGLYELVSQMVKHCKADAAGVDRFLQTAISDHLQALAEG